MSKTPLVYKKNEIGDIDAIFRPEFKFDTRGRLVLPLTPYQRQIFSVTPGSRDVKTGTESESGSPMTDPGSLKTGSLHAQTVIYIGSKIALDARIPGIAVGESPGGAGSSFIMTDKYLIGTVNQAIRFGWFLENYSEALKAGDFVLGNWPVSGIYWNNAQGVLNVKGNIIVNWGVIGGWEILENELRAGSGSKRVGLRPGSWPVYAGSENPETAPFAVNNEGEVFASAFYMSGGKLGNQTLSLVNDGVNRAVNGLNSEFRVQKELQGYFIQGDEVRHGLNMTKNYLGYYSSVEQKWKVFIHSSGKFWFQGDDNHYITWDPSTNKLTVKGDIVSTGGQINAEHITVGYLDVGRIQDRTLTAMKTAINPGEYPLTSEGGWTFKLPSGTNPLTAGILIKDSNDVVCLKMNQNAFITRFQKAFAAAANTAGTIGTDWLMIYCENSQYSPPGQPTGTIQLPESGKLLIKHGPGKSYAPIISIYQGWAVGAGVIDTFGPFVFFNTPGVPGTTREGMTVVDTNEPNWRYRFKIYLGGAWRVITVS